MDIPLLGECARTSPSTQAVKRINFSHPDLPPFHYGFLDVANRVGDLMVRIAGRRGKRFSRERKVRHFRSFLLVKRSDHSKIHHRDSLLNMRKRTMSAVAADPENPLWFRSPTDKSFYAYGVQ